MHHRRISTTGIPRIIDGKLILTPNPEEEGTSDLVIHLPVATAPTGKISRTIYLEAKKPKGGTQREDQKFFEYRVTRAGCEYYITRETDEEVITLTINTWKREVELWRQSLLRSISSSEIPENSTTT